MSTTTAPYFETPKGNLPINPEDLTTLDQVTALIAEAGSLGLQNYTYRVWGEPIEGTDGKIWQSPDSKDERVVYTDDRRLYQLIGPNGEIQSAGQVLKRKQGPGHWDLSNPGNWTWFPYSKVEPIPESVDQGADVAAKLGEAAALGFTAADRELLKKIAVALHVG